jgi:hypothetical protein
MKRFLVAATTAALMLTLVASVAMAAPAAQWKVYTYNSSGQAYASKIATTYTTGRGFDFLSTPDTALLTTSQDKSLLGDLTGKTLTAEFTITGANTTFTYYGAPDGCNTAPAVRLYFEGNSKGKFTMDTAGFSKFWWSNPEARTLAVSGSTVTISVPLTTAGWSDWGGELASAVPAAFDKAVASVSSVGVSFGGGCFFANGVGVSAGSAQFILTSYTVTTTP